MKLSEAIKITEKAMKNRRVLVEQIRMNSPDDRNSYIVLVRMLDGTIYQVDDDHPWPKPKT